MVDLGVYGRTNTLNDYRRAEEEFLAAKQAQEQEIAMKKQEFLWKLQNGGADKTYMPIAVANELAKARQSGDMQRVNDIMFAAKMYKLDAGQMMEDGVVQPFENYNNTVQSKAFAQEMGSQIPKNINEPSRENQIAIAKIRAEQYPNDPMLASIAARQQQRAALGTMDNAPQREQGIIDLTPVQGQDVDPSLSPENAIVPTTPNMPPDTDQPAGAEPLIAAPLLAGEQQVPKLLSKDEWDAQAAARKTAAESAAKGELTPQMDAEKSRKSVSTMVDSLKSNFKALKDAGAIVDSDKGALHNLGVSAGASGLGQYYSKISGAKIQDNRKNINDIKPQLLLAIMRAGGASAKALDSNNELKIWLQTTGDTTASYQSNMMMLDNVEKLMGQTSGAQPPTPQGAGGGAAQALKAAFPNMTEDQIQFELKKRGLK